MSWQSWPNLDNNKWFEESPCGGRNTNECGWQWSKVKCFCSIAVTFRKFYVQIFNTHLIRLRVTEGPNMNDQIESCAFHSFLEEVQIKCLLPTCDACIITTWRLGLQAPLVALFSISFGTYNRLQQQWQHVGAWWTTKSIMVFFLKGLLQ